MKLIQMIVGAVVLLYFVGLLFSGSDTQPVRHSSTQTEKQWYQGGTLHGATIGDWKEASYSNQLATAGDWATGALGQSEVHRIGLEALRGKAAQLVQCVNNSTKGLAGTSSMSAPEIAAACIVLMKWR